jgi:hypothetical protein
MQMAEVTAVLAVAEGVQQMLDLVELEEVQPEILDKMVQTVERNFLLADKILVVALVLYIARSLVWAAVEVLE